MGQDSGDLEFNNSLTLPASNQAVTMRDSVNEHEEQERKEMLQAKRQRDRVLMKEKRVSDLYGNFTDPEPSLPPADETEIHLPHYITLMDRFHLKARMLELKSQQEKAQQIARYYRDQCSELKAKLVQKDAEIMQLKLDAATQGRLNP